MVLHFFIISTMFIFLSTTLGSLIVLLYKGDISEHKTEVFLSFAGGIMLSASIFSLLLPALESKGIYEKYNLWFTICGIIIGALIILIFDAFLLRNNKSSNKTRNKKLFFAMTLHNIPEGLAVGLSFGTAFLSNNSLSYLVPFTLALGIGIQNFPEGTSTSFAMLNLTKSKKKSFLLGTLSGSVEPIASLIGFIFAIYLKDYLSLILAIGCGSMLYVVIDEIFVNKNNVNSLKNNISFLFGFLIMLLLDVLLG